MSVSVNSMSRPCAEATVQVYSTKHGDCTGTMLPRGEASCRCPCHDGPMPTDEDVEATTQRLLELTIELNAVKEEA